MKKEIVIGVFSVVAAIAGGLVGRSSAPTPDVHIYNPKGEDIAVDPTVASNEFKLIYAENVRLTSENQRLEGKISTLELANHQMNQALESSRTPSLSKEAEEVEPQERVMVSGDYVFTLKQCQIRGTQVDCELTVSSESSVPRFKLLGTSLQGGPTIIIDREGDEYLPTNVSLGSSSHKSWISNSIEEGIPKKIKLTFNNVPENTKVLSGLKVLSSAGSTLFKDVVLQ